jgi:hypothetical protein
MTTFDKRERAFGAKFALDQEILFKIGARRNKLFGLWAAKQLGLSGVDAEAFGKLVVNSDFRTPGRDDVFEKVWGDFQDKGLRLAPDEVRRKLQEFLSVAREQILPPAPRRPNHGAISAAALNRVRRGKAAWSWQQAKATWTRH